MFSTLLAASGGRTDVLNLVLEAGPVGKTILLLLLFASIASWAVIIERFRFFRTATQETRLFLQRFHSGARLAELRDVSERWNRSPVVSVFKAAFHEVSQLAVENREGGRVLDEEAVADVKRMIERAVAANTRNLERALTYLATLASTAPFVGLFGTVWGIMESFRRIATSGASNLESYAPGIAEALIATAVGLFAAIPAAVGYNSFLRRVRVMVIEMDEFHYDFIHLLEKRRRRMVG